MPEAAPDDVRYREIRALHWVMAFIFFFLALATGYLFDSVANAEQRVRVHELHVSLGLLFLMMLGFRCYWVLRHHGVRASFEYAWQRRFAYLNYSILYFLMLSLVVSGLVRVFAGGDMLTFFRLIDYLPPESMMDQDLKYYSRETHHYLTQAAYVFLTFHLLGAFNFYFKPLKRWRGSNPSN